MKCWHYDRNGEGRGNSASQGDRRHLPSPCGRGRSKSSAATFFLGGGGADSRNSLEYSRQFLEIWATQACDTRGGRKLLCGGGDGTEAHLPNPPPLLGRRAGRGVWAGAALCAVPGGGGGPTPTYMAHVALIILTTHMWGKFFREKNFSGPKFVFRRLWWQPPSLHKTKGLARKPISRTPPLLLLRRVPMPSPPTKQFSGRPVDPRNAGHMAKTQNFTNKAKRNPGILWFLATYLVQRTMEVHHQPHHKAILLRMVRPAVRLIPGPSPRGYMPPLVVL